MKISCKLVTLVGFILLYNAIPKQAIAQSSVQSTTNKTTKPLQISGVYPHLAVFKWETYKTIDVPANGYEYFIFPDNFSANWIRIKTDKDCTASAFFHFMGKGHEKPNAMFTTLGDIDEAGEVHANLIRPAAHNKNLQVLNVAAGSSGKYAEVNEKLQFIRPAADSTTQMKSILRLEKNFEIDDASVIIKDSTGAYRLPKTSARYDQPFAAGWTRGARELESERYMLNAHGTLYEVGRVSGFAAIRPVTTHKKKNN